METWRRELYHHGIKGQKWGVRRFQNPDGSLTSAGRKRYGASGGLKSRSGRALGTDWKDMDGKRVKNPHDRLLDEYRDKDGGLSEEGRKKMKQYAEINAFSNAKATYEKKEKQARDERIEKRYASRKAAIDLGNEVVRSGQKILDVYDRSSHKKTQQVDLSSMSDQELRRRIERMNLEQQYLRMTTPPKVSKGRQAVENVLTIGGGALAVASSAVSLAIAIDKLKSGS